VSRQIIPNKTIPNTEVSAFVLAGGFSSRMGIDKARIPFPKANLPMAVSIYKTLESVCKYVHIIRREPDDNLPWIDDNHNQLQVILESQQDVRHPLIGVQTALRAAKTSRVLIIPCDVPFFGPEQFDKLLNTKGNVVVWDGEHLHPMIMIIEQHQLDNLEQAISAQTRVKNFVKNWRQVLIEPQYLRNINRWSDTSKPHPKQKFIQQFEFLAAEELKVAVKAEQTRQQQKGILWPPEL